MQSMSQAGDMQPTSAPPLPPVAAFRRELLENLHDRVGTDLIVRHAERGVPGAGVHRT